MWFSFNGNNIEYHEYIEIKLGPAPDIFTLVSEIAHEVSRLHSGLNDCRSVIKTIRNGGGNDNR